MDVSCDSPALGRGSSRRDVLAAAILVAAIFAENLVARQANELFMLLPGVDKILHAAQYALVFVCFHRFAVRLAAGPSSAVLMALTAGIVLSITDEAFQGIVPGRNLEVRDAVADWAGLGLGCVIFTRPQWVVGLPVLVISVGALGSVTYSSHVLLKNYSLALRFERQHEFGLALQHYRLAFEAGMRSPTLFNELAWVEVESGVGNPASAVEYGSRAVFAQPDNADFLDTYGWALHHAGRSREALEILKRAYDKKPDMYCIHYHLGAVYVALNERDLALTHLRRQLLKPDTREAVMARQVLQSIELHQIKVGAPRVE